MFYGLKQVKSAVCMQLQFRVPLLPEVGRPITGVSRPLLLLPPAPDTAGFD